MPISLEPDKRFPVVLDCDKDKPKESRPTFYVLSQTMRGHLQILETLDKWSEDGVTPAALFEATCEQLTRIVAGWQHMGQYEFGKADLRDMLTYSEARELLRKCAYNSHLEQEEKKS